ncbi:unnamed protein product [Cuscuta europaea]|uniref:Uncharacterized protein n=1 Tax=Cuscuta europaea TaxID=41803 RepID=A0A9P0ZR88_CUSEU|nr:unnamed protein product [Cuscuta europaea]
MDRSSVIALAKAKAREEMAAKEATRLAATGEAQLSSGVPMKPPTQPKKKRPVDDGQKRLTKAGMQPSKKSMRASPSTEGDAGASTVPAEDVGGSNAVVVVDMVSAPSSTAMSQPPPIVQDSRKKRAEKELAVRNNKLKAEYPVKGGVFNDAVDGHDVLAQAVPIEDRAYLKKLGPVRIYDGGMDFVVQVRSLYFTISFFLVIMSVCIILTLYFLQGALMLKESHEKQQRDPWPAWIGSGTKWGP